MYTCIKKIIKYQKKTRGKWLCHLMSPLSKDETVLICVHCILGTCVHEHISPLLGEHPRIVNICLGPVTVHYREVSLYMKNVIEYSFRKSQFIILHQMTRSSN